LQERDCASVTYYLRMSPVMISVIPLELIWLTVITAMVMAGVLAATAE
jgi:hypothetical protein